MLKWADFCFKANNGHPQLSVTARTIAKEVSASFPFVSVRRSRSRASRYTDYQLSRLRTCLQGRRAAEFVSACRGTVSLERLNSLVHLQLVGRGPGRAFGPPVRTAGDFCGDSTVQDTAGRCRQRNGRRRGNTSINNLRLADYLRTRGSGANPAGRAKFHREQGTPAFPTSPQNSRG